MFLDKFQTKFYHTLIVIVSPKRSCRWQ